MSDSPENSEVGMAYTRVRKSAGHSSIQKKPSQIVSPPIDSQTAVDSLASPRVEVSSLPSKEERNAIRSSLFEKWADAAEKREQTPFGGHVGVSNLAETNQAQAAPVSSPVAGIAVQAKLTVGVLEDKYEQEVDRVAAQVVNQINAPVSQQPNQNLQPEEISEEDGLQKKSETETIQRKDMPEEELQMKLMLQLQADEGVEAATSDLESSIVVQQDGAIAKTIQRDVDVNSLANAKEKAGSEDILFVTAEKPGYRKLVWVICPATSSPASRVGGGT